jgi:hypothetical protein
VTIPADIITCAKAAKIETVLEHRGIKLHGKTTNRCGACPRCGGDDRFGINIKKQLWYCRGCGVGGDVIALVQFLDDCIFAEAIERLTNHRPQSEPKPTPVSETAEDYEAAQHRKAAWLWANRKPIKGSIAEGYLRMRMRGQHGVMPPTLAFLPARKPGQHPAMIAAFGFCDEPEPGIITAPSIVDAVHLTLLVPDGSGKAEVEKPKLVVGRPLGRPIVLAAANDLLGLAITEGIEDGLTARLIGIGVWVAGNAPFMPSLADAVPDYIDAITIYAHPDKGECFALELAQALDARGFRDVFIEGIAR